jgi:methionyl-tRNA formyltransferase
MRIDAGMDTGDILLQREIEIGPAETAPELATRMSEAGAPLMEETLRRLATGKIIPRHQNHAEATLAPILEKEDGRIDWHRPAHEIYNRMRGFAPWPGAYTTFRGQTCHLSAEPVSNQVFSTQFSGKASVAPGTLCAEKNALFVFCGGATVLRVQSVKLEGRKQVSASEFAIGARLKPGERFGDR